MGWEYRYLARTILPTCYPEFSKQNILASGTVSPQGVCASPYDSLKGSAAFWCVTPSSPFLPTSIDLGTASHAHMVEWNCLVVASSCRLCQWCDDMRHSCRYNSTSYLDDMAWAATWLYSATGQIQYLSDAYSYWTQHRNVRRPPPPPCTQQWPIACSITQYQLLVLGQLNLDLCLCLSWPMAQDLFAMTPELHCDVCFAAFHDGMVGAMGLDIC